MINMLHENPGVVIMELERNKAVQIQNWVWQREIFESWFQRNVSRNPYNHRSQTESTTSVPEKVDPWLLVHEMVRDEPGKTALQSEHMMSTTLNGSLTLGDWIIEHRFGSVPRRAKCPASLSWPSLSNAMIACRVTCFKRQLAKLSYGSL